MIEAVDLPNIAGLDETEVAAERSRLEAGEPWCTSELAGLQFYDYGTAGLDGGSVIPRDGDRLNLVRAPENQHDGNAVEVWWRNSIRLGHLPRRVAAIVAGPLDAGVQLRAYVAAGGTGEAWSAKALLVGEPVRELHEKRIEHAVERGLSEWE
ncbi:MAG: HIRAN domain-containing protein [Parafilimonas terrae]|nr:HIRAN domain-containing protein [Parafilimonas terrae]